MFGKNKTTKVEKELYLRIPIVEIFNTIQGEGPFSGRRAVFVRFAGCNLKCFWCDTDFESKVTPMSVDQIIEEVSKYKSPLVVITGGEPMLRTGLAELCMRLFSINEDMQVQIETAGTVITPVFLGYLQTDVMTPYIVCSPKTPEISKDLVPYIGSYKYIITENGVDPEDGLPNVSTQAKGKLAKVFRPQLNRWGDPLVYVSPCDAHEEKQSEANLKETVNSVMKFGYTLSLQVHKIINMP